MLSSCMADNYFEDEQKSVWPRDWTKASSEVSNRCHCCYCRHVIHLFPIHVLLDMSCVWQKFHYSIDPRPIYLFCCHWYKLSLEPITYIVSQHQQRRDWIRSPIQRDECPRTCHLSVLRAERILLNNQACSMKCLSRMQAHVNISLIAEVHTETIGDSMFTWVAPILPASKSRQTWVCHQQKKKCLSRPKELNCYSYKLLAGKKAHHLNFTHYPRSRHCQCLPQHPCAPSSNTTNRIPSVQTPTGPWSE